MSLKKAQKKSTDKSSGAKSAGEREEFEGEMPLLIKKYPNRRLYNTSTSAYIVLDDVVELVRNNVPFVIEDTKTGEDLTRSILNQIIFEQETKPSNFHFPLEFQKQLIGMYGDNYGQMVPNYLTESLKLFAAERSKLNETMGSMVDRNARAVLEYSESLARHNMDLFKRSLDMFSLAPRTKDEETEAKTSAPNSPENKEPQDKEHELKELQKQIDALQARLKSLSE